MKLGNVDEVRAFYERINEYVDLNDIYKDARFRKYYWNIWTSLCVGHKTIALVILSLVIPIYKLVKQ